METGNQELAVTEDDEAQELDEYGLPVARKHLYYGGGPVKKFSPERVEKLLDYLRKGNTRNTAIRCSGISKGAFYNYWLPNVIGLREAVEKAEAEAEAIFVSAILKAAQGYKSTVTRRKTRTVIKNRRERMPDGTVVDTPVAIEAVDTDIEETDVFDWKASESYLKRRSREQWGDRVDVDIDQRIRDALGILEQAGQGQVPGGIGISGPVIDAEP